MRRTAVAIPLSLLVAFLLRGHAPRFASCVNQFAQSPVRGAFLGPREPNQAVNVVELVPDPRVVAAHGLGLQFPRGVLLLGHGVGLAERAEKLGEMPVVIFRVEIIAMPVGIDLIPCAMPAEQGG